MFALKPIAAAVACLIAGVFRLAITPVKTTPPPGAADFQGAAMNNGSLVSLFMDLKNNAAPAFANWDQNRVTGVGTTYTAAAMLAGIIRREKTAAITDTTATATDIVNAIPGATVGQTFAMLIANLNSGILTIAAGTGVTLTGTATLDHMETRLFVGKVTGSAAATIVSCFGFGGSTKGGQIL